MSTWHFLARKDSSPACKAKVDVGFILDSSGSLRNEYDKEKNFTKALAKSFGVSEDGARAGVVTFSYNSELSIKLSDHKSLSTFDNAVDEIPLMGYTTRIDKALSMSMKELFLSANGGRPGIPKVLILMTDGTQSQDADAEDPNRIASEIRNKGIKLVIIGIGTGVDKKELLKLGGNHKEDIFTASTFEELLKAPFIDAVTKSSCDAGTQSIFYLYLFFNSNQLKHDWEYFLFKKHNRMQVSGLETF